MNDRRILELAFDCDMESGLANLRQFTNEQLIKFARKILDAADEEIPIEEDEVLPGTYTNVDDLIEALHANQQGPDFADGPAEEGFEGPRPWNGFSSSELNDIDLAVGAAGPATLRHIWELIDVVATATVLMRTNKHYDIVKVATLDRNRAEQYLHQIFSAFKIPPD